MSTGRLSQKEEAFCLAYVKNGGNRSAAYRDVFKPKATAKAINEMASRLANRDKVKARISVLGDKAMAKTMTHNEITADRIIREYERIALGDIRKAVKWGHKIEVDDATGAKVITSGVVLLNSDEIDDDTAASISEISEGPTGGLKIKFHDKKGALDALAKIKGLFIERQEVTHIDPAMAARAEQLQNAMFALLSNLAQPALVIDQPKRMNGNGSGNGHANGGDHAPPEPEEWPK